MEITNHKFSIRKGQSPPDDLQDERPENTQRRTVLMSIFVAFVVKMLSEISLYNLNEAGRSCNAVDRNRANGIIRRNENNDQKCATVHTSS